MLRRHPAGGSTARRSLTLPGTSFTRLCCSILLYIAAMSSDDADVPEPRGAGRLEFDAEVGIRRAGIHAFRVRLLDASPESCRIELVERPAVGERIWIKFDGLEPVEGIVRWVAGHVGGVDFTHPFHEAVFERLAGRLKKNG